MLCPAVEAVLSLVAVRGVGRGEWGVAGGGVETMLD